MPQIPMPYTVNLDHTLRVTPLSTLFAKGDSAAHRFELTIMRAGVQEELTGCTVMCKFYRMADSAVVSVPGSVEDRKAVAVLKKSCYDYIGRFALTISIQKGEEETTVFYGDGYMHGQRADTSISGEYIIYDINTLLEKIAEIDASTQAANTATSNANTATANANTATGKANKAANTANTAATNANAAKDEANAAAGKINNMTVSAMPVSTGTATAALSTVDGHYHIALGLPKGDTGATPQISVQVQTGAAGSEAQVSVSGTAENPIIHLTIPRGDVGNIGALTINEKAPDGSGAVTLTAEDVHALPSGGTAADSSKLGGKAPAYYMQPRNLLDNSDFRNPVNQRGATSYTGAGYTIDRWKNNSAACKLTVENGCIHMQNNSDSTSTATQFIRQKIENPSALIGKTITIAARVKGNCRLGCEGIGLTYPNYVNYAAWTTITLTVDISAMTDSYIAAILQGENKSEWYCSWIALYEGSYTADTLPPYVPKGYAAEFAECRRYYKRFTSPNDAIICAGYVTNSTKYIYINPLDNYPMRINKPSCSFSGNITVRGINGYIAEDYRDAVIRVYANATGCISMIEIARGDSAAWNATNNTPLFVTINANSVFELIADL